MSQLLRLKLAKQRAEALLVEEELTELPVDPFALAASRDIVVEAKPDLIRNLPQLAHSMSQ